MILQGILQAFSDFILWIIEYLPEVDYTFPDISPYVNTIGGFIYTIMTETTFLFGVSSFIFWVSAEPVWNVIKFIYNKIPALGIR